MIAREPRKGQKDLEDQGILKNQLGGSSFWFFVALPGNPSSHLCLESELFRRPSTLLADLILTWFVGIPKEPQEEPERKPEGLEIDRKGW